MKHIINSFKELMSFIWKSLMFMFIISICLGVSFGCFLCAEGHVMMFITATVPIFLFSFWRTYYLIETLEADLRSSKAFEEYLKKEYVALYIQYKKMSSE